MSRIHQLHGELEVCGGFDYPTATLWLDASDSTDVFAPPVWESDMMVRCEDPDILADQLHEATGHTLSSEFRLLMREHLKRLARNELVNLPDADRDGNVLEAPKRFDTLLDALLEEPTTSQED